MTREQILRIWPNASESTIAANLGGSAPSPKSQQVVRHDTLATPQREESHAGRIRVSISSYRRRFLDPDNLQGGCKYFVDCCRYAGLIPDDRPQDIILEVSQHKVKSKAEERTEITVEPI